MGDRMHTLLLAAAIALGALGSAVGAAIAIFLAALNIFLVYYTTRELR